MTLRLIYEFQVLTAITCGNDEVLHLLAGNRQRRILPVIVQLKMIIIIGKKGQGWCVLDILLSLFLSSIYEKKIRDQRLQNLLLFTVYRLANLALGDIYKRAVGYNIILCPVFPAV